MISSLDCIDFREEYTDEFDSSRKVRNKNCQHFEINMKLYSNKGKFKKYTITFTCKFCKNDCVQEFYDNEKRFEYECIKCKNRIVFSYINTLDDTVNPETTKKPDKGDNNKKFDFNEINKHDKELIYNQVNAKFPLNKENNEAKLNIYKTPSFQPEPKIYQIPNNPHNNYSDSNLKIYQTPNNPHNNYSDTNLKIYQTPNNPHNNYSDSNLKIYQIPNNPPNNYSDSNLKIYHISNNPHNNYSDPKLKIYQTPNNPPNNYSDPKLNIYQNPNQKVNDDIPAPTCQNIQNTINNKSNAIKKVKIKFVFNDSNNHIELNPSISMEQQYDIIQKKFDFKGKKKIYFNGEEIDYKKPLSEIKCLDKYTFEIAE
jgi:hypothetical protein